MIGPMFARVNILTNIMSDTTILTINITNTIITITILIMVSMFLLAATELSLIFILHERIG